MTVPIALDLQNDPPAASLVSVIKRRRSSKILSGPLVLMIVVAGMGLPISAEVDHDGDIAHVAAPHSGHGVAFCDDLQLERPVMPVYVVSVSRIDIPDSQPVPSPSLREQRIDAKDVRAPPDRLPRPPPA